MVRTHSLAHPFPPGAPFRGRHRTSTRQVRQRLRERSAQTVATTTGGLVRLRGGPRRVVGGDLWDCAVRHPFPLRTRFRPALPFVVGIAPVRANCTRGYGSDRRIR